MDRNRTFFDYVGETFTIFGFTMTVVFVLTKICGGEASAVSTMFALGSRGIAFSTAVQFLAVSAGIVLLRFLCFSGRFFRKLSVTKRMILMLLLVLVLMVGAIVLFDWFPVDEVVSWIAFAVSFMLCFLGSVLIVHAKERLENKQLAEALAKKQKELE